MAARAIAAMLMTVAAVAPASAKKNTMNFDGATTSGFNAMDHRLQKPLGNASFPEDQRGFGKHFFIGFNAGGALLGNNFSGGHKGGGTLGFRMGSWFTPVHGIRIGANIGNRAQDGGHTWYHGYQAEYLMNLTSLLRGYNPNRRFELIASLGGILQRDQEHGLWGTNYGFVTSLQARFNVEPSMYLYLEPRLAVLGGAQYDSPTTVKRLHTNVGLNFGVGYRILTGRYRAEGSSPFTQKDDDNLYFGGGFGGFAMLTTNPNAKNPYVHAFVGKMFSSTSALEGSIDYGYVRVGGRTFQHHLMMASLDYSLNLNNAFGGYRPDETFQMYFNIGATAATLSGLEKRHIYPGFNAGLMGLFRLSPNWGLYFHPQVYAFGNYFYRCIEHKNVPLLAVDLGLRYTIGNYSVNHEESQAAYDDDAKKWFFTGGAGAYHRMRGHYGNGGDVFFGFGKRFTPVSSWRVNFQGTFAKEHPYADAFTLHADYLASLTTGMYGYNPDRLFDLQVMAGAFAGTATYSGPHKPTFGLEAGVQANFRLNSNLDLFVEPQALAIVGPGYGNTMIWVPDLRVQLGLRYKLGTPVGERGNFTSTEYGERRNFIGISFGGSEITTRPNVAGSKMRLNPYLDVNVGRWFSMVSGLRAMYSHDFLKYGDESSSVSSVHLDYMLDVTQLMDRREGRRFHVLGIIGAGAAFGSAEDTKTAPVIDGGVQFRYSLPANFDIHLEPGFMAWGNKVLPADFRGHKFVMAPRLSIGTSYRF